MKRKFRREEGQGLVEYALILVLVAIVVIAILSILGPQINLVYVRVMGGFYGQSVSGTGQEVIVLGDAAVQGSGSCKVSLPAGTTIVFFDDGSVVDAASPVNVARGGASAGTIPVSKIAEAEGNVFKLSEDFVSGATPNCSGTVTYSW